MFTPPPQPDSKPAGLSGRFKKMRLPTLRRSRTSYLSPEADESSVESSPVPTTSTLSFPETNDTLLTVSTTASTSSSTAKHEPSSRPRAVRPASEYYPPGYNYKSGSISSPPVSLLSPLQPRVLSIQDNQWVHQSFLVVFGQVGTSESSCQGTVTVHHSDGYPSTQWPVLDGYFKALVHLDPGPNKLRFEYSASKTSSFSTNVIVNMLPLSTPPLHLAILLGRDSSGEYECQSELKQREGNGIEMATRKLRMAAYMMQAFTGEQMYRNRLGRRCFRLEEEWSMDNTSNRMTDSMRNIARVHTIRVENTVEEIRQYEARGDGKTLRRIADNAIDSYFGFDPAEKSRRYFATVFLDARGDLRIEGITTSSSLDGGLGIVGSRSLYTLPSCIEEVVPAFSDCTRIENHESVDSACFWEAATAALANMMEAFLSPKIDAEPRSFQINRTFITKEPYNFSKKTPGLKVTLPNTESSWPRTDCLRFRYHPCFRLPTDPLPSAFPDNPQIYAVENGIVAGASSGITLILIYAGGTYWDYLEYTSKPDREVLLQEGQLRSKLPDLSRSTSIRLRIFSAGQGEAMVDDFSQTKASLKVQLSCGMAFKSTSSRQLNISEMEGSQPQEVVLHSLTKGRMLTGIRVYHSSALAGLEFLYEDKSSQLFGHRGSVGGENESSDFTLDARKGELLVGFSIRSGAATVNAIEILTSLGRRSAIFGNPQGSISTLIPPRGRSIAGIAGSCADNVDKFCIIYM